MARFALALVISVWLVGTAVSTEFLRYVEDLPLASGLVEDTSAITVFDKPNGRIVETRASGMAVFDKPNGRIVETRASGRLSSVAGVMTFYRETLPQLGWMDTAPASASRAARVVKLRFVRAREMLSLSIAKDNGGVTVQFAITPH